MECEGDTHNYKKVYYVGAIESRHPIFEYKCTKCGNIIYSGG